MVKIGVSRIGARLPFSPVNIGLSIACSALFGVWRENSPNEAKTTKTELEQGGLQITDVLLGDETFGAEDLVFAYEKAGGYVLTPKQLPAHRRSWKNDLYEYRKETIELLFQRIIQAFGLKKYQVKGKGKNRKFILASF